MIVIGVDPGIANTGWAVIQGSGVAIRRLDSGVIKSKSTTPTGRRLNNILKVVFDIIVKHRAEYPESKIEMGVEDIFFAKNVNSAISTGKVIGTLECLSDMYTVPITLVNPQQVKKTVLGKGRGSKDEVRDSLNLLLGSNIKEDHEADACGVAMFVLYRFQQ